MKPNNNKEFFEEVNEIFYKFLTNRNEIVDSYREYFTHEEPESFDSVRMALFLDTIKDQYIDCVSKINELIEQAYHRFLRGLDLE